MVHETLANQNGEGTWKQTNEQFRYFWVKYYNSYTLIAAIFERIHY